MHPSHSLPGRPHPVQWSAGDADDIVRRVKEHLDGGADHVLLQPLGSLDEALGQLEVLAAPLLTR